MKKLNEAVNEFYYRMALNELRIMNNNDPYKGLSYNSVLYLNVISMTENCTASKIAAALNVTKAAATIKINELCAAGAIVRVKSEEDRRVTFIKLADKMNDNIAVYDRVFDRIEETLKGTRSESDIALFTEILEEISAQEWET